MTKKTRLHVEILDDRCLLSFSPATSFPVGVSPEEIVTADFNNDGKLDLATANYESTTGKSSVSVLLGDGQGGFGAAKYSTGGSYEGELAAGDFNNDGKLDLATASMDVVRVRLGNGDGTFQSPFAVLHTPATWADVGVADFNADQKMDLVVTGFEMFSGTGYIGVLLGNGAGAFTTSQWDNGSGYFWLAINDLNTDGTPDLVFGDPNSIVAWLGNGDGTLWQSYWTISSGYHASVGDFTGDGIPDLVIGGQTLDVLPGLGDGTFAAPLSNPTSATGAEAVADFNGDAKLDVVTSVSGSVSVFLGQGNGILTPAAVLSAGSSAGAVAVGNFNIDKRPDVAIANYAAVNTVGVLLNDGKWGGPSPARVTAVTINGGAVQRSRVTTMTIDFDQIVTLPANPADAFQLKRQSDNAIVGLTGSVTNDSATHVTLTFSGAVSQFGSLEDGRYTLTVLASKVSNTNGSLDGDYNGTGGDNFVLVGSPTTAPKLFRFFGDADGNGIVNQADFVEFRNAFNNGSSAIFDFDGNGSVTQSDFDQFRNRFNLTV